MDRSESLDMAYKADAHRAHRSRGKPEPVWEFLRGDVLFSAPFMAQLKERLIMYNQRPIGRTAALATVGLLIPSSAWAQPFDCGYGYHSHMWNSGAAGLAGLLLFFLLLVAAIALAMLLVRWLGGFGQPREASPAPLDILKERFARGEIDQNEFEERRRVLGD